jgi:hypothetical protein
MYPSPRRVGCVTRRQARQLCHGPRAAAEDPVVERVQPSALMASAAVVTAACLTEHLLRQHLWISGVAVRIDGRWVLSDAREYFFPGRISQTRSDRAARAIRRA